MFDLSGKVALITGGNGGIGLGMATGLAQSGARVVIAGRNQQKSEAAADGLRKQGLQADAMVADVSDESAVSALFAQIGERCGQLHILINNAGINVRRPAHEMSLADWTSVLDTNLTSAFLCSRAAYPMLKSAGGGKIINIGSMMSIFGASFAPAYGASKGGIVQFTRSIAAAWAPDRIQANAVLPGWIDTELTKKARTDVAGLHDKVLARTPAGRWGTPADMAGIAVFLASNASDFVTGTAIPVDGGYSSLG